MVILHHNSNTETDSRINSLLQNQLDKIYLTVQGHTASKGIHFNTILTPATLGHHTKTKTQLRLAISSFLRGSL